MCLLRNLFWGIYSFFFLPSGRHELSPMHTRNSTNLVLPFSVSVAPVRSDQIFNQHRLNSTACSKDLLIFTT